jgi:hypothetical protein
VQLKGLHQFKTPMTSSGIEPATFQLVAVPQPTTLPSAASVKGVDGKECTTVEIY